MASGKHRGDGGSGFSAHGRDKRGVPDGEQNPGRTEEAEREAQYSQAEADARAQRYAERHRDK
jgi:hypothetical protein